MSEREPGPTGSGVPGGATRPVVPAQHQPDDPAVPEPDPSAPAPDPPAPDPPAPDPAAPDPAVPAAAAMPVAARSPAAAPRWRGELWAFLELLALSGFVVLQPLLDVMGRSPDFFLFHGVTGTEILVLVGVVALVPPAALWGLGALTGLAGRRVRRLVHLATVGGLALLLMIQVGKQVSSVRGLLLAGLALVVTAVIIAGYVRFEPARQVLRFAAVGPLVFVLLFTFASPASALLRPGSGGGAIGPVTATGPHPPVVLVVFDEFPLLSLLDGSGGIDINRFPNFARFAGESTWYRNATGVAGWTPYAMPAMLTGRYPDGRAVAGHYAVYPENLFTLLGTEYRIEAIETVTELCPPWHCGSRTGSAWGGVPSLLRESASLWGEIASPSDPTRDPTTALAEPTVAERLDEVDEVVGLGPEFLFDRARNENRPARYQDFLDRLGAGFPDSPDARPELHVLHMLMPHTPWSYLPSGTRYPAPHLPMDGADGWLQLAHQRHLLQVAYTDRLLGEILASVEAAGVYDDALVAVTSDHGHSFTPGATGRNLRPGDTGTALTELAWVPLFIKAPGQAAGVVDDRNWQHVDFAPTVADLANLPVPWEVDGLSALRERRDDPQKIFYDALDMRNPARFDGTAHFASVLGQAGPMPPVPPAPLPELVGTPVGGPHPAAAGGVQDVAELVENAAEFGSVDPDSGTLPALVHGSVPAQLGGDALVAVAVNGRIGAVVPVATDGDGVRQFAALVADERLFRPGENRLELYQVVPDPFAVPGDDPGAGVTLRLVAA